MADIYNGFFLFLVLFLFFIFIVRVVKSFSPATLLCLSALGIYGAGFVFFPIFEIPIKFFAFSSSYWFFTFSMMMVFFAVYKSISLRMMLNLENAASSLETILSEYIQQESYTERLNILVKNKFITKTSKGYVISSKGETYARIILSIQKIFKIEQSG